MADETTTTSPDQGDQLGVQRLLDIVRAINNLSESLAAAAPDDGPYVIFTSNASLTSARVTTDSATVAWSISVSGQISASVVQSANYTWSGTHTFSVAPRPSANDASALGVSGTAWADLFLASGGVINWNAGDVTITHSSNALAFAGASSGYSMDALLDISGSAAGQIKFPATANPSSNANTLDDYEEGTFTPVLSFGGGSTGITYSNRNGYYTKIGNMVYGLAQMSLSSKGSDTGNALMDGLPFTEGQGQGWPCAIWMNGMTAGVGDTTLFSRVLASTTTTAPYKISSGNATQLTDADFGNSSIWRMTFVYSV